MGAEQVPLALPAPRTALLELFVCLFITQVFFKKNQAGPASLRGVIWVQIFLR